VLEHHHESTTAQTVIAKCGVLSMRAADCIRRLEATPSLHVKEAAPSRAQEDALNLSSGFEKILRLHFG
jgi:hypothetical protein